MAQVETSVKMSTEARYPKRKRAQVDYYEHDANGEEMQSEDEGQDAGEYSQPKVRKATKPMSSNH